MFKICKRRPSPFLSVQKNIRPKTKGMCATIIPLPKMLLHRTPYHEAQSNMLFHRCASLFLLNCNFFYLQWTFWNLTLYLGPWLSNLQNIKKRPRFRSDNSETLSEACGMPNTVLLFYSNPFLQEIYGNDNAFWFESKTEKTKQLPILQLVALQPVDGQLFLFTEIIRLYLPSESSEEGGRACVETQRQVPTAKVGKLKNLQHMPTRSVVLGDQRRSPPY